VLLGGADGGEGLLGEGHIRPEGLLGGDPPVAHAEERPFHEVALLERDVGVALDKLERGPRRGEEELVTALADQSGLPMPRARWTTSGSRSSIHALAIEP